MHLEVGGHQRTLLSNTRHATVSTGLVIGAFCVMIVIMHCIHHSQQVPCKQGWFVEYQRSCHYRKRGKELRYNKDFVEKKSKLEYFNLHTSKKIIHKMQTNSKNICWWCKKKVVSFQFLVALKCVTIKSIIRVEKKFSQIRQRIHKIRLSLTITVRGCIFQNTLINSSCQTVRFFFHFCSEKSKSSQCGTVLW